MIDSSSSLIVGFVNEWKVKEGQEGERIPNTEFFEKEEKEGWKRASQVIMENIWFILQILIVTSKLIIIDSLLYTFFFFICACQFKPLPQISPGQNMK